MKLLKFKIYAFVAISLCSFQGFGQETLSLQESRKLALEYNQRIKIADELISESESNVKFAFTHFLPNLSAEGNYNYLHDIDDISLPGFFLPTANSIDEARLGNYTGDSDVYFPGLQMEMGNIDYYSANLILSQPIYAGGKVRSNYNMAKLGSDLSLFNRKLEASEVTMETDEAYWNLVSVNERVKVAEKYVDMLNQLVTDLKNAFDLELTTKNELLKAQVQFNQAKLDLFRIKNARVLSSMALCQVIGKDLKTEIITSDTLILVENKSIENNFIQKAMQQRPEILMLGKQVEIDKQEEISTRADYLPQLGVGASYGYTSKIENLMESRQNLSVQASLSVPIFHWNERKHRVAAKKYQTRQRELQLDRTKDLVSLEVQQAYFNLQEAYQQKELADISMSQAEENVSITKNSFYEGLANATEMLDAQAFWQQAHTELIDAKINFKLKESGFLKAIGELAN
ncbi:TolC family protein [Marinifilum caeruleilacunae]|uniref:TolC family protein n=1 Tax=Marinifilum caeruleilacunae TaxID=2499076 RepID=A0ABX1WTH6_9BACT|nr:TolC family protein [Marinifilum caeruleilacunae]NOU59409.1 TolC family protein [Marinifilum caeruleilacunae]